jgi:hypothetical protein
MKKAMAERGDNEMTIFLGAVIDIIRKQNLAAGKPKPEAQDMTLEDLLVILMSPTRLKRMMAQQMEDSDGDVGLGMTINKLLVEDRNKACMKVLERELVAGKKKIAIFYGAAHMPDFDKRLKDMGLKRVESEWLDAWNLK